MRIKKIYKFALGNLGAQCENFQVYYKFYNEDFKLAQKIKGLIEGLTSFLKE